MNHRLLAKRSQIFETDSNEFHRKRKEGTNEKMHLKFLLQGLIGLMSIQIIMRELLIPIWLIWLQPQLQQASGVGNVQFFGSIPPLLQLQGTTDHLKLSPDRSQTPSQPVASAGPRVGFLIRYF